MKFIELILAQQTAVAPTLQDPFNGSVDSLGKIFAMILNLLTNIGWAVVLVMLAIGFLQYVTSQGDKTKVETAQKVLTYAIIGGVGLFLIAALKTIIPKVLNSGGNAPGGNVVVL